MHKEIAFIPLFEQFIKDSYSGKRLKADGKPLNSASLWLLGDLAQADACAGAVKSQILFSVAYMR
jgi:hypothetical protein